MVGPNSESITLGNMWASTHRQWETEMEDLVHDEYTTAEQVMKNKKTGTGSAVEFSFKYQGYSNVTSNGFESGTTVTPEYPQIAAGAHADWGTYELFPMFLYDTMKANQGSRRKFDLVKELLDEAGESINKQVNESMWAQTQVATKFTSLRALFSTTPSSGSIHNASRTNYSVLQHQAQDGVSQAFTDAANSNLRSLYNNCSIGHGDKKKPNRIWSNLEVWTLWESVSDPKDLVLMNKDGAKGTKTTEAFQFRTCLWFWDRDITTSTQLWMLNMDSIYYYDFSKTMPGKPIPAGNGRFETMECSLVGQVVCRKPRLQGTYHTFVAA